MEIEQDASTEFSPSPPLKIQHPNGLQEIHSESADNNEEDNILQRVLESCTLEAFSTNSGQKHEGYWSDLFHEYFRSEKTVGQVFHDDCLYFVKWWQDERTSHKEAIQPTSVPEERFYV